MFARLLAHLLSHLRVSHLLCSTVGAADGGDDVALHLRWCENVLLSCPRRALQGCCSAIPAREPVLKGPCTACNCVAESEGSEAMSGGTGRVLEEDLVLLLWSELLHGCVRRKETIEE